MARAATFLGRESFLDLEMLGRNSTRRLAQCGSRGQSEICLFDVGAVISNTRWSEL